MHNFRKDCVELLCVQHKAERIDRRTFIAGLAALGLGPTALMSGSAQAAASELVICNYGGDAIEANLNTAGKTFTAETGVAVKFDGSGPTEGAVRKMAESGKVTWDLTDGEAFSSETLGVEGLYLPIDYATVDEKKIVAGFKYPYFATTYFYSNVIAYDASKFSGNEPKNWADYFNVKDFPGKRGFYKWMVGVLEAALMADGVAMADVYSTLGTADGEDRALAKIKEFKPNIAAFWGSGAESQQILRDGDVSANFMWNTRAVSLDRESNGQLRFIFDQATLFPGGYSILKGGPAGTELALKFITNCQKVENQIALFKILASSPANPEAGALLTAEEQKYNGASEQSLSVQLPMDIAWYAKNYNRVLDKYLAMIAA